MRFLFFGRKSLITCYHHVRIIPITISSYICCFVCKFRYTHNCQKSLIFTQRRIELRHFGVCFGHDILCGSRHIAIFGIPISKPVSAYTENNVSSTGIQQFTPFQIGVFDILFTPAGMTFGTSRTWVNCLSAQIYFYKIQPPIYKLFYMYFFAIITTYRITTTIVSTRNCMHAKFQTF